MVTMFIGAIVGAVASIASAAAGAAMSARATRKLKESAKRTLQRRQTRDTALMNRDENQTATAQGAYTSFDQQGKETMATERGIAAVNNNNDSALAAQREAIQKGRAKLGAQVVASHDAVEDKAREDLNDAENDYEKTVNGIDYQNQQQQASATSKMISAAGQAAGSIADGVTSGSFSSNEEARGLNDSGTPQSALRGSDDGFGRDEDNLPDQSQSRTNYEKSLEGSVGANVKGYNTDAVTGGSAKGGIDTDETHGIASDEFAIKESDLRKPGYLKTKSNESTIYNEATNSFEKLTDRGWRNRRSRGTANI